MVGHEYRVLEECGRMENARLYSAANALQRADARRVLQQVMLTLSLPNNAKVLDVGCGSGDVTAEILLPILPKDIDQLVGVDVSERMITHARKLYENPKLSFVQMDFEKDLENNNHSLKKDSIEVLINGLQLDDDKISGNEESIQGGKFDAVFSFYCLHWIQNQRQVLGNIFYLLKPNGTAVLVFLANASVFLLYEKLAQNPRWTPYMKDYKKFTSPYCSSKDPAKDFSDLAETAGFQVSCVECENRSFVYSDKTELKGAIKAVNPFYTRLPADEGEAYLNDCLELVKSHQLAENVHEGIRVSYTLLVARLQKL